VTTLPSFTYFTRTFPRNRQQVVAIFVSFFLFYAIKVAFGPNIQLSSLSTGVRGYCGLRCFRSPDDPLVTQRQQKAAQLKYFAD